MNNYTKISDKLSRVGRNFKVERLDNGYYVDVSGNNRGAFDRIMILCKTPEEVIELFKEYNEMDYYL
jgi:mannose/fructose/N-acetylgalactosamine-specific phosphotransferase system component IIB